MKLLKSKILYRLLLGIVPVTSIILLLASLLANYLLNRMLERYVPDSNIKAAEIVALKVSEFINIATVSLSSVSEPIAIEQSVYKKNLVLKQLLIKNANFKYLYNIGTDGKEIANTSIDSNMRMHMLAGYIKNSLEGSDSVSKINLLKDNIPYLEVCVPVTKWRKAVGALCGEVDFRTVWQILDETTIGKTGYAVLVMQNGEYLSHPDKRRVLKNERISTKTFYKMKNAKGSFIYTDSKGRDILATYSTIENIGWRVVVLQDSAEVFQEWLAMKKYFILSTIFLIAAMVVFVYFVSRQVTRPIEELTTATKIIGAGNITHIIQVNGNDETAVLAKSFNKMVKELNLKQKMLIHAEKLSSLGQFAASIGHEIKNPLGGILGYVQLLKNETQKERVVEFAKDMEVEIRQIQKITERLSTMARQKDYQIEEMNLNSVVERCMNLLEHHFTRTKRIKLNINLEDNLPEMNGDKSYLQQAVVNLLLNASDASAENGEINISTWHDNNRIFLQIEDCGTGINEKDIEMIYEPFFTTKSSSQGTGLGLYITNEIIKLHNGTIEVESRRGVGTKFTIYFDV
ncbi:MAG: sensor histidine kinase [Victivallales bacterium]